MVPAVSRLRYLIALVALAAACSSADLKQATVAPSTSGGPGTDPVENPEDVAPVEGTRDPERGVAA